MTGTASLPGGRLRTAMVAATLAFTMLLGTASGALAFGGGSQDTGSPPPTSNPSNPGNPPGSGGGGGTPTYSYWTFNSVPAGSGHIQEGCAATNGQGGSYVGVTFRYRYPYGLGITQVQNAIRSGAAAMAALGIERLSSRCMYDGAWKDATLKCILQSTATAEMVAPRRTSLATKTTKSAYGNGDKSIAACRNSKTQAYVSVSPEELGRYRITAHSLAVNMVIRQATAPNDLTGAWEADKIVSVSQSYRTNPMSRDGYLICSGFYEGVPSKPYKWNADDCDPNVDPPKVRFQCVDLGSDALVKHPGMNGEAGVRLKDIQMLGNGETFTIEWNGARVTSDALVSVDSARTRLLKTGDWLPGKQWNQQNAEARLPGMTRSAIRAQEGTNWQTGVQPRWQMNLYGAQVQTWQPQYLFNLTARVTSVAIDGLDEAGNFIMRPTTINVSTTKTCSGPGFKTEALRVVNF